MFSEEQQALRDSVVRLLDKSSSSERVREAEPLGFDPRLWAQVVELGLLDAAATGDASLVDLAVVAEQWGAHLAPGPFIDPLVADRLAYHFTELEVGRLLLYRSAQVAAEGAMPLVEGSMSKLANTEAFTRAAADVLDLFGEDGLVSRTDPQSALGGLVEHAWRHSTVTTIYGGSSEIQRGIIAEKALGLPRTR